MKHRRCGCVRRCLLALVCCAVLIWGVHSHLTRYSLHTKVRTFEDPAHFLQYYTDRVPVTPAARGNTTKTVLLWTKFFYSYPGWKHFHGKFESFPCAHRCDFTLDRRLYNESAVVVFNERDYLSNQTDQPKTRNISQIWLLHETEPPDFVFSDFSRYKNVFNWTSFTRNDSDVPNFYSRIAPLQSLSEAEKKQSKKLQVPLNDKPHFALWMVSNCISQNGREWYVRELKRHLPITIYGYCNDNARQCLRHTHDCLNRVEKYRFHIAFENANCRDYVTEKLWRAYDNGAIPVVMGFSNNYKKYAPKDSYIDAADFSSPAALAEYLHQVDRNETLYLSYFKWRDKYAVVEDYWCKLCTAVHTWDGRRQSYRDLVGWHQQDYCLKKSTLEYIDSKARSLWFHVLKRLHMLWYENQVT